MDQNEKDNDQDILEGKNVFTFERGQGKGYICSGTGNQEVNVSSKPKHDAVPRRKRTITFADNLIGSEDEAVLLAKLVRTDEQRIQQREIMPQFFIDKEVNTEVDEAYGAEKGKQLKDDDKDDIEDSDMDIDDDDSDKEKDDAAGFGLFMYDKTKELSIFTPSAKHNKLGSNFKKEVEQKFKEYVHKLEALLKVNVPEAIEESVQAKVMPKLKKQLPIHVLKVVADIVKPHLDKTMLNVMKNNQIKLFTSS
nr:hypothetical protein [Tanacetum cinerariifolium]